MIKQGGKMNFNKLKEKLNLSKIINIIIILGICLRCIYVSYTNYDERQHDIEPGVGHIAYIEYIYANGKLPDYNKWQFYHPPLHHIISATWMKIMSVSFFSYDELLQGLKILPLIYSILILVISKKILKEIGLKDKYILLVMMIMAFHPAFIYSSAWVNNDQLTYMLTFAIILYLIKWMKNIHCLFDDSGKNSIIKNTIILAIFMGLCVMTKLNGALIAVPVAIMFIYVFIKYLKDKNIKQYIGILAIFGIISLSLGLWYPVRNYIKFGQSLTYVPTPGEHMYIGDYSLASRIFGISKTELIDEVFCDLDNDHNLISFVIKSSIFGEYNYYNAVIAQMLKLINIIFVCIISIVIIKSLVKKSKKELGIYKILFLIIHLVNIASFIYFNIQKPYACTMDFRYIVITVFSGMVLLAIDLQNSEEKKYYDLYSYIAYVITFVFSITSGLMFLVR